MVSKPFYGPHPGFRPSLRATASIRLPTMLQVGAPMGFTASRLWPEPSSRRPFRETRRNSLAVWSRLLSPNREEDTRSTSIGTRSAGRGPRALSRKCRRTRHLNRFRSRWRVLALLRFALARYLELPAYRGLPQPSNPSRTFRTSTQASQWLGRWSLRELQLEDRCRVFRLSAYLPRVCDLFMHL